MSSFCAHRSQKCKSTNNLTVLFLILGSRCLKSAHTMFVKLTPEDWFHSWNCSTKFLDCRTQSFVENDHFKWKTESAFLREAVVAPIVSPELDDELFFEVVLVVVVTNALTKLVHKMLNENCIWDVGRLIVKFLKSLNHYRFPSTFDKPQLPNTVIWSQNRPKKCDVLFEWPL